MVLFHVILEARQNATPVQGAIHFKLCFARSFALNL
jgi:hypothetical protein